MASTREPAKFPRILRPGGHETNCIVRATKVIGNRTFRARSITAYLKNTGKLEVAQHTANHEWLRTTKLYDRRQDEISLDEVERIRI